MTISEMDMQDSSLTPTPDFTPDELQQMHKYCLKYRDLVREGQTPTLEQDENFFLFQRIAYAFEVAYVR